MMLKLLQKSCSIFCKDITLRDHKKKKMNEKFQRSIANCFLKIIAMSFLNSNYDKLYPLVQYLRCHVCVSLDYVLIL